MVRKMFILFLLLLPAVCVFSQQDDKDERKKREASLMKDIEAEHGPIHFVGKIIDQNGDPVADAEVEYFYNYFCLGHEYFYCEKRERVRTDKNGVFEIKAAKARLLNIDKVLKDGYDSGYEGKSFEGEKIYGISSPSFNCRDEKTGLAVFKVRKKGEPTLLISSMDKISFVEGEHKSYAVCLVPRVSYYHNDTLEKAREMGKRIDLIVDGDYEDGLFKIKVKPLGDKPAGVLLGDSKLYIAPESGYKNEEEIVVQKGADRIQQLWLYARTGSPVVYSRVDLKVIQQEKTVIVEYSSYLNPYGERGFEGATNIGWLGQKCTDIENEANKALKEGKYAPKPDFKALEEEGKKEYLKTHKDTQ